MATGNAATTKTSKKTAVKKNAASKKTKKTTVKKKNLVIVESPSKAKTIERFLGKDYSVVASNGHLRDLPKSKIGVDIDNNFEPQYTTIRGKAPLIKSLKSEAKKASKIYLATDPDREGEAISWHIANMLDLDPNQACRIEFNEITKTAVKNAIKEPRALDMNRVDAQQARRVLDRLVGYKLSPLLWRKVRKGLSAGRVQSVSVKIIVDRENEIRDFNPEEFWEITALLEKDRKQFNASYYGNKQGKVKLENEKAAKEIVKSLDGAEYIITAVKSGKRNKNPLPPFTTSLLQQAASAKLGFTAKKTMRIAQGLYEGVTLAKGESVGLITYMRTDSTRISKEAQSAALDFIKDNYGEDYAPKKPNFYKGGKNSQDAHEAIRPTYIKYAPEDIKKYLKTDEYKLYKLIYTRFLASQMTPAVFETLAFEIEANGNIFKSNGSRVLFKGHLAVYDSKTGDDELKMLPKAEKGDKLNFIKLDSQQKFTQPPSRFTEGSLIKYLEEKGIGRPSTYAPTISTILERGYVAKEAKSFVPTELGEIVNDLMVNNFKDIVDIAFTADMEEKLDDVEQDGIDWKNVIKEFYAPFEKDLEIADQNIEHVKIPEKVSDIICEKCGANMVYKMGRFGEFLACPNYPKCKNTKTITKEIDVPCPKCGSKVLIRRSKKGRAFYGCEKYPGCDFVSWDKPLNEKCPECGAYMTESKYKSRDKITKKCSNPDCITNKKKTINESV